MSELKITSNNHSRYFSTRADVPSAILADQFDWIDPDASDHFFCYRETWYHLSEFMPWTVKGGFGYQQWDGIHNHTAFSGVCIRYTSHETYQVGSYSLLG